MPTQYQIEQAVGIDIKIAQFMMREDTSEARSAMGLLKLAMTSADMPTMALLRAAVDDCRKAMRAPYGARLMPAPDRRAGPRSEEVTTAEMFTAVFRGTRDQGRALGMLFGEATPYGELVHIGLGNEVDRADQMRAALRGMVALWDDVERDDLMPEVNTALAAARAALSRAAPILPADASGDRHD